VNEYHPLKLRSPIRDWSVQRDSVTAGTLQIQIQPGIPIPGFSYLNLPDKDGAFTPFAWPGLPNPGLTEPVSTGSDDPVGAEEGSHHPRTGLTFQMRLPWRYLEILALLLYNESMEQVMYWEVRKCWRISTGWGTRVLRSRERE